MEGFDFSDAVVAHRRVRTGGAVQHRFRIERTPEGIDWCLGELRATFSLAGLAALERHLALKMLINAHSTLVMGRLRRYEANVMTYVSATNHKLIDRAVRYARVLLKGRHGLEPSYAEVVKRLFVERGRLAPDESIVHRLVEHFSTHSR